MKAFTVLVIAILFSQFAIGQSDSISIQGKIIDEANGQPLMFATVAIYKTGADTSLTGTETDLDGNYQIFNLDIGFYDVEVSYVGYKPLKTKRVRIVKNKTTALTIELSEGNPTCRGFLIYKEPLIRFDNTTSGRRYTSEDLENSPIKN